MDGPDESRILYDDQDEGLDVIEPAPLTIKVALLALLTVVVGVTYLAWGSVAPGSNKSAVAQGTNEATPIPATGFNASSSDFEACDGTRQARPDFSIVVAGPAAAGGQQVVSRVVQFVVVDSDDDARYGPDVQAQSLCTLP